MNDDQKAVLGQLIKEIQVNSLLEFFGHIKSFLDKEGFSQDQWGEALIHLADKHGFSEDAIAQLETELFDSKK